MEEQRALRSVFPATLMCDAGHGHRLAPVGRSGLHLGQLVVVHEGELRGLLDHAAIGGGETTGLGAVDDHATDGQLAIKRFIARFEVDGAGKAAQLFGDILSFRLGSHQISQIGRRLRVLLGNGFRLTSGQDLVLSGRARTGGAEHKHHNIGGCLLYTSRCV